MDTSACDLHDEKDQRFGNGCERLFPAPLEAMEYRLHSLQETRIMTRGGGGTGLSSTCAAGHGCLHRSGCSSEPEGSENPRRESHLARHASSSTCHEPAGTRRDTHDNCEATGRPSPVPARHHQRSPMLICHKTSSSRSCCGSSSSSSSRAGGSSSSPFPRESIAFAAGSVKTTMCSRTCQGKRGPRGAASLLQLLPAAALRVLLLAIAVLLPNVPLAAAVKSTQSECFKEPNT